MIKTSLRRRINGISIAAFLSAVAVVLAGTIFFSLAKNKVSREQIAEELKKSAPFQIEALLPSFLLPEQKEGLSLLLDKFRAVDDLSHASIISDNSQLPQLFSQCRLSSETPTVCESQDSKETAVIFPIKESNQHFGYLLKAKFNSRAWFAGADLFELVALLALLLGGAFGTIYYFVAKLMSKTIPTSIDSLIAWIEADLSERQSGVPALPFEELDVLREKITEVMERHARSQDQAAIGQLTSGIMHDIKTPLQSVVTAMHLVEEQPEGSAKRISRLENLASMCKANVPVIGAIIETTLDSNRDIAIQRDASSLSDSVKFALEINKEIGRLRGVTVDISDKTNIEIPHDSTQLSRALSNLIKNAIEAASESSSKKIVQIEISNDSKGEVIVSVEDSGPGINGSHEKLFRAFRSSKVRGTGLGLHISRKIVHAHGGSLKASKSLSLGGAKFEMVLPVKMEVNL